MCMGYNWNDICYHAPNIGNIFKSKMKMVSIIDYKKKKKFKQQTKIKCEIIIITMIIITKKIMMVVQNIILQI